MTPSPWPHSACGPHLHANTQRELRYREQTETGSQQTVRPHGTQSQPRCVNFLEPSPMLQAFAGPHFNPAPLQGCAESRTVIVLLRGRKANTQRERSVGHSHVICPRCGRMLPSYNPEIHFGRNTRQTPTSSEEGAAEE